MIAFAAYCIIGAISVAVLMMFTTPRASIRAAPHDAQAMWGMVRRLFYISIAGGNAGAGFWLLLGWATMPASVVVFWLMVNLPIVLFLIFRWRGWIDQDYWIGGYRRRALRPQTVHEAADQMRDVARSIQNPGRRAEMLKAVADYEAITSVH